MMSDMVPTGVMGAELADIRFGDSVLTIGIGPVGLMAVAAANPAGRGPHHRRGQPPGLPRFGPHLRRDRHHQLQERSDR